MTREDDKTTRQDIKVVRPAAVLLKSQRTLARWSKDGRLYEVTGRRIGEVAIVGLFGGEERWVKFDEVEEVRRGG